MSKRKNTRTEDAMHTDELEAEQRLQLPLDLGHLVDWARAQADIEQSVLVLVRGIADLASEPLATALRDAAPALAAAVIANTPAQGVMPAQ